MFSQYDLMWCKVLLQDDMSDVYEKYAHQVAVICFLFFVFGFVFFCFVFFRAFGGGVSCPKF